jgi:hypothetical protein
MTSEHPCLSEGTRDTDKADSEAHWICHRCHWHQARAAMTGTATLDTCHGQRASFNFGNSAAGAATAPPAPAGAGAGLGSERPEFLSGSLSPGFSS